ncbi:putative aminotransferase aclI [Vanrija pseudolonga]|uniref:Aminotransferase aclI n=1 Tax=Vanrija pseudolonga TaxID=143232 RepID=A0AAF0XZS0_9TREE|nr:putative aminotransferase aclI [Vanrija pseudolonga]
MTPVQVPVEATTAALAAASLKESGTQHKSALNETFTIPSPNHAVVGEWADAVKNYKGPPISDRAKGCSVHDTTEKLDALFRTSADPEENPDGAVSLALAENSLMINEYHAYFKKAFSENFTLTDMGYGNQSSGSARLNKAIASYWNDHFHPITPIEPDDIVTGPGATGILDQLLQTLVDPGEGILIPAPHYNGFFVNMVARSGTKVISVNCSQEDCLSDRIFDVLEEAKAKAEAAGTPIRVVMLCSPHNPYGQTLDKATIVAYARFAEKHNLHLIADEIYALSVYDNENLPNAAPFISVASLDFEKETGAPFDKSRVHIVYSVSKDFGANGLRIGCVISQHNPVVLRALLHTVFLMKVSSAADVIFSSLLNDRETLHRFTAQNRKLLTEAAKHTREWFEERGCKPLQTNAGHFILVDIRPRTGITTFEEERNFVRKCMANGVMVSPASNYLYHTPGWLRVTFSVDRATLDVGLERLGKNLDEWKK